MAKSLATGSVRNATTCSLLATRSAGSAGCPIQVAVAAATCHLRDQGLGSHQPLENPATGLVQPAETTSLPETRFAGSAGRSPQQVALVVCWMPREVSRTSLVIGSVRIAPTSSSLGIRIAGGAGLQIHTPTIPERAAAKGISIIRCLTNLMAGCLAIGFAPIAVIIASPLEHIVENAAPLGRLRTTFKGGAWARIS